MDIAWTLMKWPLLACVLLPGILVYYGLHIVRREVIFVDLALAQVAALGACLAVLLGHDAYDWQTYAWGIGFTFAGAVIFTLSRTQDRRVPQEALIGIVYVVTVAAGILLLSRNPEGNEQLKRTMLGDVLLVRRGEVLKTFVFFLAVGLVHYLCRKQFLLLSFDPNRAMAEGLRVRTWDLLFYILFGLMVTSYVQIGGVLLVFSYLVIPAVCASYLADSLVARLWTAWSVAIIGGLVGVSASYELDLPTGPAIVCALGGILLVVGAGMGLWRMRRGVANEPTLSAPAWQRAQAEAHVGAVENNDTTRITR